jgi:hypothetical protein
MLGDGRLAQPEVVDQFADRPFAAAKQVEDLAPPGFGEHLERSCHTRNITAVLPTDPPPDVPDNDPSRKIHGKKAFREVESSIGVLQWVVVAVALAAVGWFLVAKIRAKCSVSEKVK